MEERKHPYVCTIATSKTKRAFEFRHCCRTRGEECWRRDAAVGQVLGSNSSFPSQGTCQHFRCPWRKSLCHSFQNGKPLSRKVKGGNSCTGFRKWIICPFPFSLTVLVSLPSSFCQRGGHHATWKLQGIELSRCQRTAADTSRTRPGMMLGAQELPI